ncbi:MAG: Ig-like domain-containing protein [Campylobacteraceae bacterium]|nr:Ig-like domain-containing protein [Campylobacteraceae bacterium]
MSELKSLNLSCKICFIKKLLFSVFAVMALSMSAHAWDFRCDRLYADKSGTNLYEVNVETGTSTSTGLNPPSTDTYDTIALGRPPGSSTLRMYSWGYGYNGDTANGVRYIDSGGANWGNIGNPANRFYAFGEDLSGGEVNQLTGEIYITGDYTSYTGTSSSSQGTFAIGVYNTTSHTSTYSRVISSDGKQYFVASDMAIDAEGNAYVLVTVDSNTNNNWFLMRINIKKQDGTFYPAPWSGDIVSSITGMPSGNNPSNVWGMAFLNGKLYFGDDGGDIGSLDPLSGIVGSSVIDMGSGELIDLASCQVSPILRGQVFNDAEGDGVISGTENGIDGLTVQLYSQSGALLSTTTTANNGTYSFIINDTNNVDFYVRVKNPAVNGTHLAQTWASGGTFSTPNSGGNVNTVSNYCADLNTSVDDTTGSSSNRSCYGKRADGIDSTANGADSIANYISKVHVTTDLAVSRANFAFTIASDRSDANFNEVLHSSVLKKNSQLFAYLGSNVTIDQNYIGNSLANSDSYDDGIYVFVDNRYIPVQERGFVPNTAYAFKADINGSKKNEGKLSVFIAASVNSWSNFGATDQVGTGDNITFSGTLPAQGVGGSFLRARYTTSSGISATANASSSASNPWVLDGEVEDYRIFVVDRQVRVALKTVGTTGNSGNFTFNMSNILASATPPSTASTTFYTTSANNVTDEPLGVVHRINSAGTAVSITVDKPQTLGIMSNETTCKDLSNANANLPLTFARYQVSGKWYDNITIAASDVKTNSDIICTFSYGTAPTVTVNANITGRAFGNDQFNLSITDMNTSLLLTSNTSSGTASDLTAFAILEADHTNNITIKMASGSTAPLSRYKFEATCAIGGITTLPYDIVGNGTFSISPTFGSDVVCRVDISTSSIHVGNSQITVIPSNNTVGGTSSVLVTLKDSNNTTIASGGDDVKLFISAITGAVPHLSNGTHAISTAGSNITAIDNGDGTYSANISSNISGNVFLTFSVNGASSAPNGATAYFHHDVPDLNSSNITIPYPNIGVSENATAVIWIGDRFNNPVLNATVTLVYLGGTAGGVPAFHNTNVVNHNNGFYDINLTSVLQGTVIVSFQANGVSANETKNATAIFSATGGNTSGNYTTIRVEPNVTNAGNTSLVTVYFADNDNNSIDGKQMEIYVNSANSINATIYPVIANGLGNGIYTANITSNITGDYNVTFHIGSDYSNKSANAKFNPNDPDLGNQSHSFIDATNATQVGTNSIIKVYLADQLNNTITNATVGVRVLVNDTGNFVPPGSNNSITYTADSSDQRGGYYTVSYSTTVAGNVTFGFSANNVIAPANNNDTTTFTVGNVNLTNSIFSVSPHEVYAGENVTITLHLLDSDGNGVDGETVTFSVANATLENGTVLGVNNDVIFSSVVDLNNGTYTATASTNSSKNVTFAFYVANVGGSTSVTPHKTDWAKFKSGNVSIGHPNTTITATSTVEVNSNSTITVTLKDDKNNPVNNETVKIIILSGNSGNNGTFNPSTATIGQDGTGNGRYTLYFTTPVSETVTFGFEVGSNSNHSKNASTIFTSGSANNTTSSLSFNPPQDSVSVESNFTATALIKDNNGNAVGNKVVNFAVSGGALNTYSCTTAADGTCFVVWTSTIAGSYTMNATIDGKHISGSPAIKGFTAGLANETTSTFLLEAGPKSVGQLFNMNATLRDKYNNTITNQYVFYSLEPAIDGAGFGLVGTETDSMNSTTGAAAISTNTLWSNLVGTYKITVRFGSETGPEITGSNQTATFIPATVSALSSNLTVTGAGPVDSEGGYYTVRTYAKDSVGPNFVPGTNINITVTNGTLTTNVNSPGTIQSIICTTNVQGYCEYYWVSPSEKGNFTITAALTNGTAISNSPQIREFKSGSANASFSDLYIVEAGPKTANGTDRYTAVITLRDSSNIPTSGSVLVSVSGGLLDGSYTINSYSVDPLSGNITIYWSSTNANNFTINATVGNVLIQNGTQIREFIPGPVSLGDSSFVITPLSSVTADNISAYTLSVNIKDAYQNNKPGSLITFDVQEGYLNNSTVSYKNSTCTTLANGNCSITWFSDKVGNFSVTAKVEGMIISGLQYRDFVQGIVSFATSNLTVLPTTSRTADNSSYFTATAYIKDALNHDITGELVTFTVNGGWLDNTTNRSTTLTCVSLDGSCSVRWRSDTPGSPTIWANVSAGQVGSTQRQFIASNAAAFNSTLTVDPAGPVLVGTGLYTATVTAVSSTGTLSPGAIIQFSVEGGTLSSDSCEANASGQCSITWTSNQSGNFSINATIADTNLGGNGDPVLASPQRRVFTAGTAQNANSTLVITPPTDTVIANSGNYYTLNITARDIYNNAVPNQFMNIYIGYGELNNNTGFTAGNSTCQTDSLGNCLVLWRSDKTGEFLVNVTIAGETTPIYSSNEDKARRFTYDSLSSSSYFRVDSYNASQPNNISVCEESESTIASCLIYYALNAYVEDNSGNKMEGANVTFRIYRGGVEVRDAYLDDKIIDGFHGTIAGGHSCVTNATGQCSANITLKANIAGEYQIYASVGSTYLDGYGTPSVKDIKKTFVAGSASSQTSRIHFNPVADNSIEANNVSYYTTTVEVLDIHSNPINNALVALAVPVTSWLDNTTAVNSTIVCTTASNGNCSVLWRSTLADNPQNITANVESITLNGTRTFITGGVNLNMSNITVSAHNVTTDDTVTVTVTVNDAQGNPIKNTNHDVVIYTSLSNSSFDGGTAGHTGTLTNVNGTYSAVLRSTKIGNTTLTFTINGGSPSSNTEWVYFNSGEVDVNESNNNTNIQAVSPVDVGSNSLVTVYLGDKGGNPIDNLSVTIYILANNTNSTAELNGLENVTINGGTGGNYTANLTAFNQGSVAVSFIINGLNINGNDHGKNATVIFQTGTVNATNSGIYVTHEIDNTTNASADGIDYYTVTVIARDAFNSTAAENVSIYFEIDKGNLSNVNTSSGNIQTLTCLTGLDGSCTVYWMSEEWGKANVTAYINGSIVSGFPIEREFRRILFDDNLTITDFTAATSMAHVGDLIRYTVNIQNNMDQPAIFDLKNTIPKGFSFVEGSVSSTTANGTVNSTFISAHEFNANNLTVTNNGEIKVVFILRVGAGVKQGKHKSYVEAFKASISISNKASAEVEITGDPMIDESLIFGTVYIDSNANGMQDEGEIGIPGVRIATAEGYIITTDQFGRYHLLNILGGEWGVGRNFIMKVDASSLPTGSTFTTANPLLRRLTPGIPVRFDFGVKLPDNIKNLEALMRSVTTTEGGAQ